MSKKDKRQLSLQTWLKTSHSYLWASGSLVLLPLFYLYTFLFDFLFCFVYELTELKWNDSEYFCVDWTDPNFLTFVCLNMTISDLNWWCSWSYWNFLIIDLNLIKPLHVVCSVISRKEFVWLGLHVLSHTWQGVKSKTSVGAKIIIWSFKES